jgi:hypothetical protein
MVDNTSRSPARRTRAALTVYTCKRIKQSLKLD